MGGREKDIPCTAHLCLRTDGICGPDDTCDAEIGLYDGPFDTEMVRFMRDLAPSSRLARAEE